MKAAVKKAEFVSTNEIQLTLTVNIPTGTNSKARFLVGLAEAGLIDVEVNKVETRRTEMKLKKGEVDIVEERHGHVFFIVVRGNQRRLRCALDFESSSEAKKPEDL